MFFSFLRLPILSGFDEPANAESEENDGQERPWPYEKKS
jgi:hypothetical protein